MWQVYDWPDALAIENEFKRIPFWEAPRAVMCPVSRGPTVRSYYQRMSAEKTARYRWCPECERYSGQTVTPPSAHFSEPIDGLGDASLPRLLDLLERGWVRGALPQSFAHDA